MAFEGGSGLLSASAVTERVRNRGRHFHLVSSAPSVNGAFRQPAAAQGASSLSTTVSSSVTSAPPEFPRFMLKPPTVPGERECGELSQAVHMEWLKGRGSAWVSGSPVINYVKEANAFQLDPPDPATPIVSESALAAALDTLEDAALDECVSKHLTEGGDDRLHLAPDTGVNRYYCPPKPVADHVIIRGSCTCSPPSKDGFEASRVLLRKLWQGRTTFGAAVEDVRTRISLALGVKTPHDVVLHPSGSDAELIPLAVARIRAREMGCSGIVNIVAAAGEVGSGTAPAAGGRHFSKFAPCGTIVDMGAVVCDFPEETEVIEIKPRQADGNLVPDYDALVQDAIVRAEQQHENAFFVVHAVDGSKTGLRLPSLQYLDRLQAKYGNRVLMVMDACQCRSEAEELDWFLKRGGLVLVTASKFFGAPGFCGGVLVPKDATRELAVDPSPPAGLKDYLSKYEVPHTMPALRNVLPDGPKNIGLLLRWICGITEMELFAAMGPAAKAAMRDWVYGVRNLVCKRRPKLDLIDIECSECEGDQTRSGGVNTVISIKFLTSCGTKHICADDLKRVHRFLTMDVSSCLPAHASEEEKKIASLECFVGQPVKLGQYGVLRLAIGAVLAREIAAKPGSLAARLKEDERILEKMLVLGKYCDQM